MEVDVMENIFLKDSVEAPSSTVERTVQVGDIRHYHVEAVYSCLYLSI